jgi:hypothetical protein
MYVKMCFSKGDLSGQKIDYQMFVLNAITL